MKDLLLTCFATLLICSTVVAQEFPTPKPTEAHKLLARDVGTWDTVLKMYLMGPGQPPTEYKGVEVNKLLAGDLYLLNTFTCKMGKRKFEGHMLVGYDSTTKLYKGTIVNSFSGHPQPYSGKYDKKTKTLTVNSTMLGPDGKKYKEKYVTEYIDENTKKLTISVTMKVGDKETDIKMAEMTAKRRK